MKKATAVIAAVGLATASLAAISVSSPATAAVSGPLSFRGSTVVSALATAAAGSTWSPTNEFAADHEHSRGTVSPPSAAGTATVPSPGTTPVVPGGQSLVTSFQGLNHYDQRTANGGNQYSLEPPDQGLCVGGGNVIESVNTALKVYSTNGAAKSAVVDLNTFFKLPAEIDRSTGVAGPFLSDPKCYYDTETARFFFTILEEDAAPSTSAYTLIAASASGDPLGAWNIFWLNATDDGTGGTPNHPNCPCFGDQPLIGADHNGFYVTTNEFPADPSNPAFNGAQVYAMSKTALENGVVPAVQQFDNLPLAEGLAYSMQPATSPTATSFSWANHGTEYLLSALDFNGTVDNRIAVWALTNTSSLDSTHPSVALASQVVRSENYGQPPVADQKNGRHPFGQWGAKQFYGGASHQAVNTLNSNDDRMNQVVFVDGSLWAGLNTAVAQPGGATKAGVAWFRVGVDSWRGTRISARVEDQGYVSVKGQNVLFPSIGVTPSGKAVLAVTLVGPGYFPSAAYAVNSGYGFGSLQVAGRGVGPADGFTGYAPFATDGVERWGDYSAAVSTPGGTVWLATEYIAQSCTVAEYQLDTTCGGTRTTLANWSTRVSAVRP